MKTEDLKSKLHKEIANWEINQANYYRSTRKFPFSLIYLYMKWYIALAKKYLEMTE